MEAVIAARSDSSGRGVARTVPALRSGHPEERQWESVVIIQRGAAIDAAEAGLRLVLTAMGADSTRSVAIADAVRALRNIEGVAEGSFSVAPFYPENFLVRCQSMEVRDRILAAPPLHVPGAWLVLRPWTRLAHAEGATMQFKVAIELEGVPPHAWGEDTAAKILAPSCWLQSIHPHSADMTDLSAYKLSAWTCDPRAIPKVVWLHIAENEPMHAVPADNLQFGNPPPYLRRKDVLSYQVLVHLRNVYDFDPSSPSPPDSDNGHDGNPDRHHFHRGTGPRIQGFRCNRGVVDGEASIANNGSTVHGSWTSNVHTNISTANRGAAPAHRV